MATERRSTGNPGRVPGPSRDGTAAGEARLRPTRTSRRLLSIADRLLRDRHGVESPFGALPTAPDVAALTEDFLTVLFPEAARSRAGAGRAHAREQVAAVLARLERRLEDAVFMGLHRRCGAPDLAD